MKKIKAVPYYRVSTVQQGQSGLGLEAQQKTVRDYAAAHELELLPEQIEIESGKKVRRPILLKALNMCKKKDAVLLIAKQNRLARNVAFISKLLESKVDFIDVDNPGAQKVIIQIKAVFDEYEREQISIRTKEALAAAKRRGTVLGDYGRKVLSKINRQKAVAFARKMKATIRHLQRQGYTSIRALTEILNRRRIATFTGQGTRWHLHSVHTLMKRINQL